MSKCITCRKKISNIMLDVYTCKCKNLYCGKHLHDHNCTFNHVKEYQKILTAKLPKSIDNKNLLKI
mgnify:CR=1 FL=1|jgi:hypothetical protein